MRRSQQSMLDDIFEMLKITPTWVGPVVAVVIWFVFSVVFPLFLPAKGGIDGGALMHPLFVVFGWVLGGAVLLAWVVAELWKLMNRRLLDSQTGLTSSIRDISWREFELLVSEAYRRKGYVAEVVGTDSGDGGVDIRLTGHGEVVLVQCKQWKAFKVGVTTVRELLGVVASEKATRGIVVTSGRFTREARVFAEQNRQIELIDGPQLAELIRGLQAAAAPDPNAITEPLGAPPPPRCPLCGAAMILRTARKGKNTGSQFWGCSNYSNSGCRGTRQVEHAQMGDRR